MSLTIQAAGIRIAADLDAAERSANETLRHIAQLQMSMMNARNDTDLNPHDGQIAVVRVQQAATKLVEATSELAKAHKSMRAEFVEITGWPDVNGSCPTTGIETPKKVA